MRSNKVEYSTASGVYCTTHDGKVPFCMPEFSIRKRINHCFYDDNDRGELGICYDRITGHELMVQLGLMTDLKLNFLQGYVKTVLMEEPIGLLDKSD